jgi:hypothetical protein
MPNATPQSWSALRTLAYLFVLFVLIAYQHNIRVASLFLGSGYVAFIAEFYLVRSIFAVLRGRKATRHDIALSVVAVIGVATLLYFGWWIPLAMMFAAWFICDAVILRFR